MHILILVSIKINIRIIKKYELYINYFIKLYIFFIKIILNILKFFIKIVLLNITVK